MKIVQRWKIQVAIGLVTALQGFGGSGVLSAESIAKSLPEDRKIQITQALLNQDWQAVPREPVAEDSAENPTDTGQQEQLWSGNVPKFDLRFSSLAIDFVKSAEAPPVAIGIDATEEGMLRVTHSRSSSAEYRGGVRFNSANRKRVKRQLLLGQDGTSVFIFTPFWSPGSDLHLMLCPRSLVHIAGNDLLLRNETLLPEALLWKVSGRLKAVLFSGTAAGSIQATIQRTDGVPPAREESDIARGVNPVADLVYKPIAEHAPVRFSAASGASEAFLMTLDMQLPAGYKRRIVEGYDLWVTQTKVPEVEVLIPVPTVLETKAAVAVPENLRSYPHGHGIKARLQAGDCTLVVAERRPTERVFLDKVDVSGDIP